MYSSRGRPSLSQKPAAVSEVAQNPLSPSHLTHRLDFYTEPPLYDVKLEEFESWAIDRLKVLAEIEAFQVRNRPAKELKEYMEKMLARHLPLDRFGKIEEQPLQRKKDHVSHFVLRLAFCKTEELRRRFVKAETSLFRIRWEAADSAERQLFVATMDLEWTEVPTDERNQYQQQLQDSDYRYSMKNPPLFVAENYVKVPWTMVPELVSRRQCFLRNGMAYVSSHETLSIIQTSFANRLGKALESTARALPRLDEDTRLMPILNNLSLGFLAGISDSYNSSTVTSGEKLTASMVSEMGQKHFPMCMRMLNDQLKTTHHLKHQARLQLGLFIKGIGLSVEEAIIFWRKGFSGITEDRFNKDYRYNVRHNYGLEGSRKAYQPKSCTRILTESQPGPGETHGCPFRHYSAENLQTALSTTMGIHDQVDLSEIMSNVQGGHYHLACTRVFEITHAEKGVKKGDGLGQTGENSSVEHPNKYFDRSYGLENPQELSGVSSSISTKVEQDPMET